MTAEAHPYPHLFNFQSDLDAYSIPSSGNQYEYLGMGVAMAKRSNLPWFSAPASPALHSGDYFGNLARMQDAEFGHEVASQDFGDIYHTGRGCR